MAYSRHLLKIEKLRYRGNGIIDHRQIRQIDNHHRIDRYSADCANSYRINHVFLDDRNRKKTKEILMVY